MLGTVIVPLGDLIKGASIHDRFPLRSNNKNDHRGTLEVKVTLIDLDNPFTNPMQSKATGLGYSKQWEQDIVWRIASALARIPADTDTLFGIFAKG